MGRALLYRGQKNVWMQIGLCFLRLLIPEYVFFNKSYSSEPKPESMPKPFPMQIFHDLSYHENPCADKQRTAWGYRGFILALTQHFPLKRALQTLRSNTPARYLARCKNENLQARQTGCINHEVLNQHDLNQQDSLPLFLPQPSFGKGKKSDFMPSDCGGGDIWVGVGGSTER